MPTDDDRRYVAKMLRRFADDYEEGSPAHVLCCDLVDLIEPTVETCETDLTDVEDLRVTVRAYECSKCGMSWEQVWAHDFTFCPYCGRRVSNADE